MRCGVCGEGYSGLAGDCRCTWYGYGSAEAFGEAVAARARVIEPTPPLSGRAPLDLDGEV